MNGCGRNERPGMIERRSKLEVVLPSEVYEQNSASDRARVDEGGRSPRRCVEIRIRTTRESIRKNLQNYARKAPSRARKFGMQERTRPQPPCATDDLSSTPRSLTPRQRVRKDVRRCNLKAAKRKKGRLVITGSHRFSLVYLCEANCDEAVSPSSQSQSVEEAPTRRPYDHLSR